jgi:cell division protease FtsH
MARNMVTKWGLSEKLGPLMYSEEEEEVFLGMSAGSARAQMADDTAKMIDQEVRDIIDECYQTAKRLLEENRDKLDKMAEALLLYETIDKEQIDDIMTGRDPRPPKDWHDSGDNPAMNEPEAKKDHKPRPSGPVGGPAGEH